MKLLLLTQAWEPDQGPPQWRLRRFVDAWLASASDKTAGNTAVLICPLTKKSVSESPREGGLEVIRTRRATASPGLLHRMLDQAVVSASAVGASLRLADRPDAVLATVPALPSAFAGYIISRRFRVPLIIDLRDAWPDLIKNIAAWNVATRPSGAKARIRRFLTGLAVRCGGWWFSRVLRHADLITTTSAYLAESLRTSGHSHVVTIRNTAVAGGSPHTTTGTENRSRRANKAGSVRVLYAGTVGRAQGLSNAIDALVLCRDAGVDVTMTIIGEGAELTMVREHAKQVDAPVDFLRPVPYEQMDAYYGAADTCLVHLRDWEPLKRTIPSKLVETMARGIPVTLAANGEPADIVRATGAGQAVPAMNPQALADVWMSWARDGVPEPDIDAVAAWLDRYADPVATSQNFVSEVEALIRAQVGH